jgi:23S rRNA-/tRNA-specific pseudouridylate synthase
VAKPNSLELPGVPPIPILYEDRSVLAIDKPRGWMLVPYSWQKTKWNLQAAIVSSISAGDFWARSRGLKFLKFVHRLDAETTGILLFAKSQGAVESYSDLFEDRRMEKTYLAVIAGVPKKNEWTCRLKLGPAQGQIGRMKVDEREGKESETHFRVIQTIGRSADGPRPRRPADVKVSEVRIPQAAPRAATEGPVAVRTLIEAHPRTGRTHQIRLHLAESAGPIVGDDVYGRGDDRSNLGLRAVRLAFADPFTRRRVEIRAPIESFCREYGFDIPAL